MVQNVFFLSNSRILPDRSAAASPVSAWEAAPRFDVFHANLGRPATYPAEKAADESPADLQNLPGICQRVVFGSLW